MILDAETFYLQRRQLEALEEVDATFGRKADKVTAAEAPLIFKGIEPPKAVAGDFTIAAEIDNGRWIVKCPNCGGAQIASRKDRRFFCLDCLNDYEPARGRWVRVIWPAKAIEIENQIQGEPERTRQNWRPEDGNELVGKGKRPQVEERR